MGDARFRSVNAAAPLKLAWLLANDTVQQARFRSVNAAAPLKRGTLAEGGSPPLVSAALTLRPH